jgi:hypothetical protein
MTWTDSLKLLLQSTMVSTCVQLYGYGFVAIVSCAIAFGRIDNK